MLLRFQGDRLDESNELAQMLQSSSAVGTMLDLTVAVPPQPLCVCLLHLPSAPLLAIVLKGSGPVP